MRPDTKPQENDLGAGNTKAALECSIGMANSQILAQEPLSLKAGNPLGYYQSTGCCHGLMGVVTGRLRRRYGIGQATAETIANLAGLVAAND